MSHVTERLTIQNFIDGAWGPGSGEEQIEVFNPSTGDVITSFRTSTAADVDRAVKAARRAQPAWAAQTAGERSALLHELVNRFVAHAEELIELEVLDAGKPIDAARNEEFPAIADAVRHFAGAARTLAGQAAGEYASGVTTMVRREPLGVVAGITPWNYPLWQAVWKVFPALATGNTIVLKPAENTPLATTRFVELAAELIPAGVINLVQGLGRTTGNDLIRHDDIDLVSFTGSVATGKAIAAAGAEAPRRSILELGGNAPVIIFDDADLPATAKALAGAGMYNAGQECMAATRLIVHRDVAEQFVALLADELRAMSLGDTMDETTALGPLISEAQLARVDDMVQRRPDRTTVVLGGKRADRDGYFFEATLITGCEQDDELVAEEIFGPVMTVQTFAEEDEALLKANGVSFGLAGSVWTANVARGMRCANALNFGNVWVNDHLIVGPDFPIGGFNESGYGKEGGLAGIEEFTRVKQVGVNLSAH